MSPTELTPEYKERMKDFKSLDFSNKKRKLIELMVFNGYNIIEVCKKFNELLPVQVNEGYKYQLITYLDQH